jgi:hypothetical protein
MRLTLRPQVIATLAAVAAVTCLFAAGHPASAQASGGYPTDRPLTNADLRLGAELPLSSNIKSNIGTTLYAIGGDYVIHRSGPSDQQVLSADFLERSAGSNRIQMIPVTFGLQHYEDLNSDTRRYFGFGLGAAFTTLDTPDTTGVLQSNHTTLYGAYIRAGVEFAQNLLFDVRYDFLQNIQGVNPSGPEFTLGVRF